MAPSKQPIKQQINQQKKQREKQWAKQWAKQQKVLRRLLLSLLSLWIVIGLWQAPIATPVTTQQIRGIWMTHTSAALMYFTTLLDEGVANLAQHQLNTLYPCVWNRGYTLHPSAVTVAAGGTRQDRTTNLPLYPLDDNTCALCLGSNMG